MAKKLAPNKQVKKAASKKKVTKKIIKKVAKKVAVKKKIVAKVAASKKATKKGITNKASVKKTVNVTKFVNHSTKLKVGDLAPYFEGKDQNGNLITLDALKGKTIVLYFYPKDDTPGCTATACSLRDEYQYLSKNNYSVIGVSADDEKSHAKFAKKYDLPFPLLADTNIKIMRAYDVWGLKQFMGKIYDGIIRTTFIIDEKGIIKNVIKSVDTANHAQQILTE
jgi:peroxiredoxin Q/BCP